ncbi:methyltransferase family protein [Paraburkholderia ferrariae]|jgi:protein-S-isoprenylcysteine O-methyltransferase Ste14|uniref:methyltransferase family protein n=1 Tax=Paraburkholderia ferrariae TaxID=386056 RepID=UPI00047F661B|nr:isoprenylcysteine carboxylmethyltransferase family protein [Paraburkholderia ferrariae]
MIGRMIGMTVLWLALMGALLFGAAGTLAWLAAWLWLAEFAAASLWIGLWLARVDPGLLAERLSPYAARGQSTWDRVFMIAVSVGWCAWLVLIGADAVRFGASHVPLWLRVAGAAAIFLCIYLTRGVFAANRYASPVVAIQRERGHALTDTGPYAHIRHPMYAYALLLIAGTPLMLGSWWGLACVPFMMAAIGWRAVKEERTLAEGLPGYRDYMQRVRYRFLPGVW